MFQEEKIVETKICKHCNSKFEITDKDLEFYEKVSPVFGGKKYDIKSPTLCPDCRTQRRLSFRNESTITFRICDLTGKRIFSMYSPDKPYKVYFYEDWFGDSWNGLNYGREFDFSRPFFEQFHELDLSVPKMSLSNLAMENSDFVSQAGHCKNCYLIFNADMDENCYYGKDIFFSKNCVDSFGVGDSEDCYNCSRCIRCFGVKNSVYSYDCSNCNYIFSCIGCKNCIGCVNLNNAEYCIFNKKYEKENFIELQKTLAESDIINGYNKLLLSSPRNALVDIKKSENVIGDLVSNSKDVHKSFQIAGSRDIRYSTNIVNSEDIMDVNYFGVNLSKSFESSIVGYGSNLKFCFDCWNDVDNLLYCYFCVIGAKNCFGCVGLHNNEQYCILNKQYTKEEYEILVPKIIEHMMTTGEWGEFFPSSISPFGYNETVAQEYFPLSKDEALKSGFNWSDYESPFPKVDKIIPASKLPEDITKIPDDILNWAIECEVTKKPFRIIKQELEFYRKHNLPIPKRHPDQRHLDRMSLRNPRKLFDRKCDKCGKDIKTTYSPDRSEIIYCEECYIGEVY